MRLKYAIKPLGKQIYILKIFLFNEESHNLKYFTKLVWIQDII